MEFFKASLTLHRGTNEGKDMEIFLPANAMLCITKNPIIETDKSASAFWQITLKPSVIEDLEKVFNIGKGDLLDIHPIESEIDPLEFPITG